MLGIDVWFWDGQVAEQRPARRKATTGPFFTKIARWEHELLIPIVAKALHQVMDEIESEGQPAPSVPNAATAIQPTQPVPEASTRSSQRGGRAAPPPRPRRDRTAVPRVVIPPDSPPLAMDAPPPTPDVEPKATVSDPLAPDLIVPGESEAELEEMHRAIVDALKPVGTIEHMLVEQVVAHEWRLRRLRQAGMAAIEELGRVRRELDRHQARRHGG